MNEAPDPTEGKAHRQSPDGPDLVDSPSGRTRRVVRLVIALLGLVALALAALIIVRDYVVPRWVAPALAGGGVVIALLGAVGAGRGGRRNRSTYRFDSSSSRALNTLGRMHGKD